MIKVLPIVGVRQIRKLFYTIINRLIFGMKWDIGNNVVFEGPVYCQSVKGSVKIGNKVRIAPFVNIEAVCSGIIEIGNNVAVNQGSYIISRESISIGNDVMIGEYCSIRDNDHCFHSRKKAFRDQGFSTAKVIIGDNVWLGRSVTISKGVTISKNVVVGANSVVTKSIIDPGVYAGVPARKIKDL